MRLCSQEEPSAEQQELILRNWGALQRSRTSVEKAKLLMMESLSNSATDRNLSSYNRRTMLVRADRPVCLIPLTLRLAVHVVWAREHVARLQRLVSVERKGFTKAGSALLAAQLGVNKPDQPAGPCLLCAVARAWR